MEDDPSATVSTNNNTAANANANANTNANTSTGSLPAAHADSSNGINGINAGSDGYSTAAALPDLKDVLQDDPLFAAENAALSSLCSLPTGLPTIVDSIAAGAVVTGTAATATTGVQQQQPLWSQIALQSRSGSGDTSDGFGPGGGDGFGPGEFGTGADTMAGGRRQGGVSGGGGVAFTGTSPDGNVGWKPSADCLVCMDCRISGAIFECQECGGMCFCEPCNTVRHMGRDTKTHVFVRIKSDGAFEGAHRSAYTPRNVALGRTLMGVHRLSHYGRNCCIHHQCPLEEPIGLMPSSSLGVFVNSLPALHPPATMTHHYHTTL